MNSETHCEMRKEILEGFARSFVNSNNLAEAVRLVMCYTLYTPDEAAEYINNDFKAIAKIGSGARPHSCSGSYKIKDIVSIDGIKWYWLVPLYENGQPVSLKRKQFSLI